MHVDVDPAEIGKNRRADVPIVGDCKDVIGKMAAELSRKQGDDGAAAPDRGPQSGPAPFADPVAVEPAQAEDASRAASRPQDAGPIDGEHRARSTPPPPRADWTDRPPPPRDARAPRLLDAPAGPSPADAPPIDDGTPVGTLPQPRTMQMVTRIVGAGPSPVTKFFLNSLAALLTFLLSMAALDFFDRMMARSPVLGWIGVALLGAFTLAALAVGVREYAAWARFASIDAVQRQAAAALAWTAIRDAHEGPVVGPEVEPAPEGDADELEPDGPATGRA